MFSSLNVYGWPKGKDSLFDSFGVNSKNFSDSLSLDYRI